MPCCGLAARPKFSLKSGTYSSPASVTITDSTRGAIIYYSTDGFTPTAKHRYLGPITINSTTTLQAIAIAPYSGRSFVTAAQYIINAPQVPAIASVEKVAASSPFFPADGRIVLLKGTPVPLLFAADVNSRTAAVGDKIPMTLADDLSVNGVIVARKGTPGTATIIQVDKSSVGGAPGVLTFQVDSLDLNSTFIPLHGVASREGDPKLPTAAILIPVVGPFTALRRGAEAVITKDTIYTACLAADTSFTALP
jgi:hypothetical protein